MAIIQHRRATEDETRAYFIALALSKKAVEGKSTKERMEADYEFRRSQQFYFKPDLVCVMWRPTEQQLFDSWCDECGIIPELRDTVRIGWNGAREFNAPAYSAELMSEIKRGSEERSRMPHASRMRIASDYRNLYLPKELQ